MPSASVHVVGSPTVGPDATSDGLSPGTSEISSITTFAGWQAAARYTLPVDRLMLHAQSGAVARPPLRRTGTARFRVAGAAKAASLVPKRFRIVSLDDSTTAPVDAGTASWSEYRATLGRLNRGAANWQMMPAHELAG